MSELSRSHAADIADTRFAAAIREAGRLAVRAMSGYGMAACGAKRSLTGALMSVKCNKRPAQKAEVADRSCRSCSNEIGPLRVIS